MNAACILVGTELLNGAMVDTNSLYIAEQLNKVGIELPYKITVRDVKEEIISALAFLKPKVDLIIVSGGLGPTLDDITKECIADFLQKKLIVEEEELRILEEKFQKRNFTFLKTNQKEVEKPEGALSFPNEVGMAPAIYIDGIAAFPGVPRELYNMLPKFLAYYIEEKNWKQQIYIKDLITYGISESILDHTIKDLFDEKNVFYEFLVKDYGTLIRMQAQASEKNKVEKITKKIYNRISNFIIAEDDERLEMKISEFLKKRHWQISVAESCTGGLLADAFIRLPGASEIFYEGIVAYDNKAKQNRLHVPEETIVKYGAVSEETAKAMVLGLSREVAISTTGIAGPDGGTEQKPVGLVYIGIRVLKETFVIKKQFYGSRNQIRKRIVLETLVNLFQILSKGVRKEL